MKNYTLKNTGSSKIAAALVHLLAVGKPGECLIAFGFSQDNFTNFLASLAVRAIAAGYDEKKLADVFRQVAACNASQARQALRDVEIDWEGRIAKETASGARIPMTLESYWGKETTTVAFDPTAFEGL